VFDAGIVKQLGKNMNNVYKNNRIFFILWGIVLLVLALVSTTTIAAEDQIKVWSKAETKVTVEKDGKKVEKKIPAVKVLPGKVVYYTTEYKNISKKSVDGINIINPIPKLTTYVKNSAWGDNASVSFSVDGGKTWGKSDKLKVKDKEGKMVKAKPSDFTHIRWKHHGALKSGSTKRAAFQVTLLKP